MDPMRTLLLDALRAMPDSAETRCMIAAMEGSGEEVGCECPVEAGGRPVQPQVGISCTWHHQVPEMAGKTAVSQQ